MLRLRPLSSLVLLFTLSLSCESRCDEPARPAKADADAAQIRRLIQQLGSDDFEEREAASRQLKKIGPPAVEALRAAAKDSKEAEVRRRATEVAEAIEASLDQLLTDYRSYGFPLPPKDAVLVRYQSGGGNLQLGKVQPKEYSLAFLIKRGSATEPWILMQGTSEWETEWDPHAEEVKPDPEVVKDLDVRGYRLKFAIQCHSRGWDKLAEYLLEPYRKDDRFSPRGDLTRTAWSYWEVQLLQPKIDRAPIYKRLKELIGKDQALDDEDNRALLKSLELALVPSKAKAGSVEALIDDLVDYTSGIGASPNEKSYWRLVDLGFEAVPGLIEHLDDDRLTRGEWPGFNNAPSWNMRVGHVLSELLNGLAGQDVIDTWRGYLKKVPVNKEAANKWWVEARKVGEERYLLDHVLPQRIFEGSEPRVNQHQLRRIEVKYPKHVPTLYRTILEKRPEVRSWDLVDAISRSQLQTKEKLDLLLIGAGHKDSRHRLSALSGIKEVDRKRFDALMLSIVKALPNDVESHYWKSPELYLAQLATESDDPQVWEAFEKLTQRAATGFRMELLKHCGSWREKRRRSERIRLLASFLDDDTVRDMKSSDKYEWFSAGSDYQKLAVRDFVAMELLSLFRIDVELNLERTPDEWAKIRDAARQTVEKELAKSK
jgi:hypothetical protein